MKKEKIALAKKFTISQISALEAEGMKIVEEKFRLKTLELNKRRDAVVLV